METIIFYILIFTIGVLFGSFSTLAVYRLPLHKDITHKRSFCPNCNHKLSFLDLIPVLSYIFLGGKCRYCKKKIRIRYLLIEVFTGIVFLLFAMSLNINFLNINSSKIVYLIFGLLYIAGIIIIAGIDKENRRINMPVIVYEIVILSIYMIYLYIVEKSNIHRYVIYLGLLVALFLINTIRLKKYKKDDYWLSILILCVVQSIILYGYGFISTAIIALLAIAIERLIRIFLKKGKDFYSNLPVGYYLCISNIITIIVVNALIFRG